MNWVKERIRAVMQSAGMGPAKLVEVGQPAKDAFTPFVQLALTEEAGMFPFYRKTGEGIFQAMSSEYFAQSKAQRYLRLR